MLSGPSVRVEKKKLFNCAMRHLEWTPPLPQEICQTDFARPCCSRVSPDLTRQTSGLPGALKRDVISDVLERITCYYIVFLRFNLYLSTDIQIFFVYLTIMTPNPFCFLYKRCIRISLSYHGMWAGYNLPLKSLPWNKILSYEGDLLWSQCHRITTSDFVIIAHWKQN